MTGMNSFMTSLDGNVAAVAAVLIALVLGVIISGVWWRAGMRKWQSDYRILEREHTLSQANAEHLRERLDEAQDGLYVKESELHELSGQLQQLQRQHVELQTRHNEKLAYFQQMQSELTASRAQMTAEFQNLANRILDEKGKTFSASSQSALEALLRPFREQIEGFQARVNQIHDETLRGNVSLGTEIKRVADMGMQLSVDASGLASALRGNNKTMGHWGEIQLERTLQLAGLVKGEHYVAQPPHHDHQNQRRYPDFVIKLPENKHIVIDSKVSLVDYERAFLAEDEAERAAARDAHVGAVRQHVDDLASKDYSNLIGLHSPSFVLMYMPVEAAYIEALRHSRDLYDYAYRKNVILVSHTTLIPVLKTVANVWMAVRSNEQAHQLSEYAGEIYNQVVIMAERLKRLGVTLGTASRHYNDTVTAVAGQQGLFGKVSRLGELSSKANKTLPELESLKADFHDERLTCDGSD